MERIKKVCIVTGASSGLGFQTSKKMAGLGYEVVMACRDKSKAKLAINRIKQDLPYAKLIYMNLDLASLNSVTKFCNGFLNVGKKLNVLVLNAAWMDKRECTSPTFTEDGVEKSFAVNYLGHFLLTLLLLDVLKSTAKFDLEARILVVSSAITKQVNKNSLLLNVDDVQAIKNESYRGHISYKNSKIANVLFALELHRQLQSSKVTCNVINPGENIRSTKLLRNQSYFRKYIYGRVRLGTSLSRAASAVVYVATDAELGRLSGGCFVGCEKISVVESRDLDLGKRLWDCSKEMVADFL